MSIAGVRSNRGDGYQTLVAFEWALTVLSDPECLWLEIDSITYSVDDVVVGKADGTVIACQCKKNQPGFKAWSISDLADELDKASGLLINNQNAEVRFYSRNNFGALGKLREHSTTQNDEASYYASLDTENQATDVALKGRLATSAPSLSSFEFLRRTSFEISKELNGMRDLLRERLRIIASNPEAAFNAIWRHLDQLGARIGEDGTSAAWHRLTKDDLKAILHEAGAMLVPPMDLAEVRLSFADTSGIGRSWRRDIAGQRIFSPTVKELLAAIDAKKRAILLTGLPGSGKTCVMLALQDALEQRAKTCSDIAPLFIQSREFADLPTAQDRQSQGLPEKWVEKVARLAENTHVIVVMDSLDVLSIARDHRVLSYFLAQIDRLLLVPNVTVVTACRDFDRHYDRRIAERKWDCELKCQSLDWDGEISPLLDKLGIATVSIDSATRELIKNPRELALFVELAEREGSFNVVTGQALAQRYLDTIVRANNALGDAAIQAIEAIASDMLRSRSLAVSYQRFGASQEILRALCSLNVIQESQDGKLVFGHQTLLDVLVISGAVRSGVTLNDFLQSLPPVPFVRPSIRSFVAQLALGERREFRKQLRTVLTGSTAFHIRRLVAESFAEQKPQDDDWPLIRDLREKHRDVFQVIYGAREIEWHHFWLKHLVPELRKARDADGMVRHVYWVGQWADTDTSGVMTLWREALSLDWLDERSLGEQLGYHLSKIKSDNVALIVPLLERLLDLPRSEHSSLGRAIAHCVAAGGADDFLLWRYIADDVTDEDLAEFRFDKKLRCNSHDFGDSDKNFFRQRMEQSTTLLDLVVESIERWSDVRESRYSEKCIRYRYGFLGETSYDDAHSQRDTQYADSLEILFDVLESAIIYHAKIDSKWWKNNRERLLFSREGALVYFAVLACTASPEANIDLIGRMLCDKTLLWSELSYEFGTLIHSAFNYLDSLTQDTLIANIINMRSEYAPDESRELWRLRGQAEFIVTIPCYQRSPELQELLIIYEKNYGVLIRQPHIRLRGGWVRAPFSYEVFLRACDAGVLCLLSHYAGYERRFDDFMVGGEDEVGWQLREAASRHPSRFLDLLPKYWVNIQNRYRDDIMDGVVAFMNHRYGNLQINGTWTPLEELDGPVLAGLILDELERHPEHWQRRRSAADALKACSNVIYDKNSAERLSFLAIGFEGLNEADPIKGNNVGIVTIGINMVKGRVVEALMILANNIRENRSEFPEFLGPALSRFASDESPAIRSLILRRLPYLQGKDLDFGWKLFNLAMSNSQGLWEIAEPCLYYAYDNHFEIVRPLLVRLRDEGGGKDPEVWGRISALATMARKIEFSEFLADLAALNNVDAWRGAATVWTNLENIEQHRDQCLAGLGAGLNSCAIHAEAVADQVGHLFYEKSTVVSLPIGLIRRYFDVLKNDSNEEKKHHRLTGFHEWLNSTSQRDPEHALEATESYLAYVIHCKPYLYDHKDSLTQLMTRLFAEAEEREESDCGVMLQRVVVAQDTLLSLGVNGVADWLKAAERP
ncbi:AAA family ATPase [Achromobacter sp. AONIH1]|uniref:AAA family ATPase n=1 Tax=Achromobacter sp. AONIH1 TaxID=1758194 RepID=UPI000CD18EF7|nr:AAA family ATPase [Achromobacter sp. AONIH1]AUT50173.1 ATP-binding protein [Achromobacter sp. AONIH1]